MMKFSFKYGNRVSVLVSGDETCSKNYAEKYPDQDYASIDWMAVSPSENQERILTQFFGLAATWSYGQCRGRSCWIQAMFRG